MLSEISRLIIWACYSLKYFGSFWGDYNIITTFLHFLSSLQILAYNHLTHCHHPCSSSHLTSHSARSPALCGSVREASFILSLLHFHLLDSTHLPPSHWVHLINHTVCVCVCVCIRTCMCMRVCMCMFFIVSLLKISTIFLSLPTSHSFIYLTHYLSLFFVWLLYQYGELQFVFTITGFMLSVFFLGSNLFCQCFSNLLG